MSIMLRAVSTSKSVRGCFCVLGVALLGCGSEGSVTPPPTPPLIPPHMTIDVRYLSALTQERKNVISAAADKWTHALLTEMGNFQLSFATNDCFIGEPAVHELHHNLLLFVSVEQVDGPHGTLAYTEICGQNRVNLLPIVSHIRIDADDLDSLEIRGLLSSVVTHEMGHALGFNSLVWGGKALVSGGFSDPYFTGLAAKTEFARYLPSYAGNTVPLEDIDHLGTKSSHWRWAVFGDEIMVGALVPGYRYPLSTVTLGLFRDIGYDVDMTEAEPYPVLSIAGGGQTPVRTVLDADVIAPRKITLLQPVALR
jgi:hypothetical protein